MTAIEIRQAISTDIPEMVALNHSCETTHVFQLDHLAGEDQFEVLLREVRLPRNLRLKYPRNPGDLMENWTQFSLVLLARSGDRLLGYLTLLEDPGTASARVKDVVVLPEVRRKGVATALIQAAQKWVSARGFSRFILEVPGKNKPGVELARKLKMKFSGYCDGYYHNLEMVLFFIMSSR
jgi:GNAT superfamily N-acetyltransferase